VTPGALGAPAPPLLADENFPGPAVAALRAVGYDLLWVAELRPGIPDKEVVAWGRAEVVAGLLARTDLAVVGRLTVVVHHKVRQRPLLGA